MIDIDTVHLILKTHLDIGFTDYAERVTAQYVDQFIPAALDLADACRGTETPFRWTVGSWLIHEYLERAAPDARQRLENAIVQGDIVWHALPFTTHTELMTPELLKTGLRISQALDARFGKQTIAAKMTDVPGHTRAMIPILADAGVRFLHIGVNPASAVPDVPPVFVWRDPATQSEIMVMYHQVYGDATAIEGLADASAIILTGDNLGPPSSDDIGAMYARLQAQFPNAKVIASTMDDFARALESVRHTLPVLTSEIGDSWIHGGGTDPTKVRHFRALQRLHDQWQAETPQAPDVELFGQRLLMVAEHTWGMDEKTHLAEYRAYSPADLAAVRQTPKFAAFEASWAEQRRYLDHAMQALETPRLEAAQAALAALAPVHPVADAAGGYAPFDVSDAFTTAHFTGRIGQYGELCALQQGDQTWAAASYPLGLLTYQAFSDVDFDRFWRQYIRDNEDTHWWAIEDYTKQGMGVHVSARVQPKVTQAYVKTTEQATHLLLWLALPHENAAKIATLEYVFPVDAPRLEITLQWFDKPANRQGEAYWLSFVPKVADASQWRMQKLGGWVDPADVVSRGGRTLHAVEGALRCEPLQIVTWDAPLVAPGSPSLLDYHNRLPQLAEGMHVNLYNNAWGTNFPMWFDDDARFRFTLTFA